jgi:aminomethyltransferase
VTRRLAGLATGGRQPPREGGIVLRDGRRIGMITSGNYSPVLGHGIALAFLEPTATEAGTAVEIEQRGRQLEAAVVTTPFVRSGR